MVSVMFALRLRDPAVAVTVMVLVPAGVPGLLGVLLPPPQAGIQSVESAKIAIRLSRRRPRSVCFRLPADTTSPSKPGRSNA